MSRNFKILNYTDNRGNNRVWKLSVLNKGDYSVIITEHGIDNGKMIISEDIVKCGKNIGKINETTHFEQAISEGESKWKKKMEKITQQILPMLATDFVKHHKKINYPIYMQPKLDGNRALFYNNKLFSRTGKEWVIFTSNSNLLKELIDCGVKLKLDGELYIHNGNFEDLGILRRKEIKEEDLNLLNKIEYHVYDIVDETKNFKERYDLLKNLFDNNNFTNIKLVRTKESCSYNNILEIHKEFLDDGYEGSIIRNPLGLYKLNYRSTDLLKYKNFIDDEFLITGYSSEIDHITLKPVIIWNCITENGNKFNVRPKGNVEERHFLFTHPEQFIGSKLWCKYFELTADGVPRFPTTKGESYKTYIRDEKL